MNAATAAGSAGNALRPCSAHHARKMAKSLPQGALRGPYPVHFGARINSAKRWYRWLSAAARASAVAAIRSRASAARNMAASVSAAARAPTPSPNKLRCRRCVFFGEGRSGRGAGSNPWLRRVFKWPCVGIPTMPGGFLRVLGGPLRTYCGRHLVRTGPWPQSFPPIAICPRKLMTSSARLRASRDYLAKSMLAAKHCRFRSFASATTFPGASFTS
jgi:hypothetical protein